MPGKTPLYTRYAYKVDATADYDGVRRALDRLERTPLLLAIRKLSLTQSATRRDKSLTVKMTIEVLMVAGAQRRDTLFGTRWFTPKPVVLAKPDRRYSDMVYKNIWSGVRVDPRTQEELGWGPRQVGLLVDLEDGRYFQA